MDPAFTNARVWDDRPPVDIAIEGERIAAMVAASRSRRLAPSTPGAAQYCPGFVEPHLHLDKEMPLFIAGSRLATERLRRRSALTAQLKAE